MTTLKVGVAGAGVFGNYHAQKAAASARTELVGVYDIDLERATRIASQFGAKGFIFDGKGHSRRQALGPIDGEARAGHDSRNRFGQLVGQHLRHEFACLQFDAFGAEDNWCAGADMLFQCLQGCPCVLGRGDRKERVHQVQVCEVMQSIPFGETLTYGDIAKRLDVPAQAIGQACGGNPIPVIIPCHRVLGATSLGGYSGEGGVETKVWLLRHEGAAGLLI